MCIICLRLKAKLVLLLRAIMAYNKIPMNLSITGKKFTTPNPKMPVSLVISQKPVSTTPAQPKPNPIKQLLPYQAKNKPTQPKSFSVQNKTSAKPGQKVSKQAKKEVKQPEPVKKEATKVQEPLPKQVKVQAPPQVQDEIGEVVVRYNHYKQKFECRNGVLSFAPIEQKYCFSDVFKGNFIPVIKIYQTTQEIFPQSIGSPVEFSWKVQPQAEYRLQIQEDQIQEAKYEKKPYIAPQPQKKTCPFKRNSQVQYITQQLKKLRPQQYGSDRHKQLLEQRDLQDVLFS